MIFWNLIDIINKAILADILIISLTIRHRKKETLLL